MQWGQFFPENYGALRRSGLRSDDLIVLQDIRSFVLDHEEPFQLSRDCVARAGFGTTFIKFKRSVDRLIEAGVLYVEGHLIREAHLAPDDKSVDEQVADYRSKYGPKRTAKIIPFVKNSDKISEKTDQFSDPLPLINQENLDATVNNLHSLTADHSLTRVAGETDHQSQSEEAMLDRVDTGLFDQDLFGEPVRLRGRVEAPKSPKSIILDRASKMLQEATGKPKTQTRNIARVVLEKINSPDRENIFSGWLDLADRLTLDDLTQWLFGKVNGFNAGNVTTSGRKTYTPII